jgi:hypothetical protein
MPARKKDQEATPALPAAERSALAKGIGFGLACAAALSAPTLYQLAVMIGYPPQLAWLLPASFDGYAGTSIWVGRRIPRSHPAAKAARRNARLALALTIGGNGLYHLLALAGTSIPRGLHIGLLVAVSSLPPFIVDRLLHLNSIANGNALEETPATATPPKQATPPRVAPPALPTVANPPATPVATPAVATPAAVKATVASVSPVNGNAPRRLITAPEKDRIVARLLAKHGDDMNLSDIADAIGTRHRATAMKVRDRVIAARTKPQAEDETPAEDPEPVLAVS